MLSNNDVNVFYQKARTFWSNIDKKTLLNSFNEISNAGLSCKYDKSLTILSRFLNNLVEPNKLFDAFEEFYNNEVIQLKQNDIQQKEQINELKSLNKEQSIKIKSLNEVISSYQHIQYSMLNEVQDLKLELEGKTDKNKSQSETRIIASTTKVEPESEPVLASLPATSKATTLQMKLTPSVSSATTTEATQTTSTKMKASISRTTTTTSSNSSDKVININKTLPNSIHLPVKPSSKSKFHTKSSKKSSKKRVKRLNKPKLYRKSFINYDLSSINVSDLNIVETLNQVKAKLQSENIPQNALTRALYNDRIGRMFYNRSKQFQRCNEQTRDCILRAFMWLHDPDGIKKLKDYMNGKYKENNYVKTQRPNTPSPPPQPVEHQAEQILSTQPPIESNNQSPNVNESDSDNDCIILDDNDEDNGNRVNRGNSERRTNDFDLNQYYDTTVSYQNYQYFNNIVARDNNEFKLEI